MSRYRKIIYQAIACFILFVFLFSANNVMAQDGAALFKANCANCHKPDKDYTGPALKGVRAGEPSPDWVYKWIENPAGMISTDPHAKTLFAKFGPTVMTAFPQLKKEEIDAILKYADDYVPEGAGGAKAPGAATEEAGGDNSLLFGILTLVLAVIAFVLLQVNSNLRKLTDEKDGILRGEPVPFYRNKTYLMLAVLVLFTLAGYFLVNSAIGLGRQKGYQPEQPIYYSHKVHAGVNQISCLYCHGGAQDSKQASIPSVNQCMNCHMAIKEYTGEPIIKEDGKEVNGTAEIQKLYSYAGWNPDKKQYNPDNNHDGIPDGARPIEWVKIHNLPDHVYFNHSQHVKVGKQQCQTCHGNIQEMPEVHQFAELSMGWCINCHRETKVDFYNKETGEGNKFYSIYEKFHNDLKNHKMDSVTVESIGGTECQKCHY
ncbi:MAG: c-type cytochrome [Bacteroidetes bacterium]|nr:c-type cytochrome [Bacteroidota bacterium]MBS1757622.1 c-type cytochrome [Bacteroidota bacterium]